MNQVWNIFRKDVRHHWIVIVASLALVAAFVWVEIEEWAILGDRIYGVSAGAGFVIFGILGGLAVPLTPISWMFLIVRDVQDESLAGARQFWVTRPYDWKRLLLAKILFVLAFVNVPYFLAQLYLLSKAGFHPFAYLGGLLWLQGMWLLLLLLPTAALASVTRSIGQMLLGLLFVALFAIGLSTLASAIPNSEFGGPVASMYFPLALGTAVAVILLQYSLRRTSQSRWIIASLCAMLVLVLVATPYRRLIARAYPPARADFPLQLKLMGAPYKVHYELRDRVPIPITFSLSGLPKDAMVEWNGYILALSNATGQHWDSGWQSRSTIFFPDEKMMGTGITITKDVLDRLKSSPMSADLLLGFTAYRDQNQRPFTIPSGEFTQPDLGYCSVGPGAIPGLSCRIALRRPHFLMVSGEEAASTCPLSKDQLPAAPGQMARAYIRGGDSPADPGLSPVQTEGVTLWDTSSNRISGLCPGTQVTLSNPEEAGRARIEVHIDSAWFDRYLLALNSSIKPH